MSAHILKLLRFYNNRDILFLDVYTLPNHGSPLYSVKLFAAALVAHNRPQVYLNSVTEWNTGTPSKQFSIPVGQHYKDTINA